MRRARTYVNRDGIVPLLDGPRDQKVVVTGSRRNGDDHEMTLTALGSGLWATASGARVAVQVHRSGLARVFVAGAGRTLLDEGELHPEPTEAR